MACKNNGKHRNFTLNIFCIVTNIMGTFRDNTLLFEPRKYNTEYVNSTNPICDLRIKCP